MANLRDEILALANPAPVFRDPENDSDDETRAKVADLYTADDAEDTSLPSALRQKTAIILGDTDRRYAGKKTSRKTLDAESSSDDCNEDDDNDDDDDDDDTGVEDDDFEEDRDQGGQNIDSTDDGDTSHDSDDNDSDDDDDEDVEFNEKCRKFDAMDINVKKPKYGRIGVSMSGSEDDADDSNDFEVMEEEDDDSSAKRDDDVDDNYDDDSSEDDDIDDDEDEESGGEDGIQKFSRAATDEVAKGQAAKQQLGLWDSLLEGRIKLQKAVVLVNQLPQTDTWTEYRKTSPAFAEEESKAQQALAHLLGSIVHLQDLLLHQNTETQDLVEPGNKLNHKKRPVVEDDDDEEIPSDSDVEMESNRENSKPATPVTVCKKRKLKFAEYPTFLKKRHESFQDFRDSTIQKWFDKTRLATGKLKSKSFSAFDQSALVQINQILADKERLIKRTQLKRSVYRVLGTVPTKDQPETVPSGEGEEHITERESLKDYDTEIFDDDDFYHQMLRELIEKKTTDVNDPIALSRQWLEIQKLRSKTKKKIDTRASKGRKVRYDVHKKLVNFMAPVDTCDWSHEARDDLFKSLFGKRFSAAST